MSGNSIHVTDAIIRDLRIIADLRMTTGPRNVDLSPEVLRALLDRIDESEREAARWEQKYTDLEWEWAQHICRDEWG